MKIEDDITRSPEVSIKRRKAIVKGRLVRAAIFSRSKVIEIATSDQASFYAVYYKGSLIYGDHVPGGDEGSFIQQTFKKGIVFESPHPALSLIIPRQPLSIPNKKKLFDQLQDHYSFHEIVYIATTLDAFFKKERLIEIIQTILSHLKRGGQHFKAFQVSQMLEKFAPDLDSSPIQSQFSSQELISFQKIYHSDLPSIQKKDPLYFEQHCFENRSKRNERTLLMNALEEQDRLLDSLLLWIEAANKQQTGSSIRKYTDIALQFISFDEWMQILSCAGIDPFQELPEKAKSFLEKAIEAGKHEEAIALLMPFINGLPSQFDTLLKSLWSHLDPKFIADHLDDLIPFLEQFATGDNKESFDQLLEPLTTHLFKENELKTVQQKLLPIQKVFPHSPVIRKVDRMSALSEDPDRMMQLGEYYAEFKQFDQAIECFTWEMEIHPEEPAPVWHLSKMYQQKGMAKEAEAYQKFFVELKKQS